MPKGGAPQVQNVSQSSEPWREQIPYISDVFATAQALHRTGGPLVYGPIIPGDLKQQEHDALSRAAGRAISGSPNVKAAQAANLGILNGDPAMINKLLGARLADVIPQLQSQFALRGGARSGLAREAEQAAISREAAKLIPEMMRMAPSLAAEDYRDISQLAAVGETYREREEAQRAAQKEQYDESQRRQQNALNTYANIILGQNLGMQGGSQSVTPGTRPNRFSTALGTGIGGATLGAPYGPMGALIGGGLGALGGLF